MKGHRGVETLRCAPLENISKKGPRNRRSLGCARDDKKERVVVKRARLQKERAVIEEKASRPHQASFDTPSPLTRHPFIQQPLFPYATALSFCNRALFTTTLPFLSSRAQPRDLQFNG